jgi:hypothetical protein
MKRFIASLLITLCITHISEARTTHKPIQGELLFFDNNKACQNDMLCSNINTDNLSKHLKVLCEDIYLRGGMYVGGCMQDQYTAYSHIQMNKQDYERIKQGEENIQKESILLYMKAFEICKAQYKNGDRTGDYGYRAVEDCIEDEMDKEVA